MAQYIGLQHFVSSLPWIECWSDCLRRRNIIRITHRAVSIIDYIYWDDDNYNFVNGFIRKRIKEVNDYLNKLWC